MGWIVLLELVFLVKNPIASTALVLGPLAHAVPTPSSSTQSIQLASIAAQPILLLIQLSGDALPAQMAASIVLRMERSVTSAIQLLYYLMANA
jgi:hypothetical protein